jgi:hypothetical protein
MYLVVFYVGEYVYRVYRVYSWCTGVQLVYRCTAGVQVYMGFSVCVYKIEKFRTLSAPSEIASQYPPPLRSKYQK